MWMARRLKSPAIGEFAVIGAASYLAVDFAYAFECIFLAFECNGGIMGKNDADMDFAGGAVMTELID
jgi:hypothetical protein